MKKLMIASVLIAALLLSGCAANKAKAEAHDLAAAYAAMQNVGALPEMVELEGDMILDYFGIESADYTDGIFMLSFDNMLADEVILVNAVDDAALSRVTALLKTRLETKAQEAESYSPEQYQIIKNSGVVQNGLTAALIVSPQYEALVSAFQSGAK